MQFVISRLSNKKGAPLPQAKMIGKTLFDDPVYGIEVNSLDDLMKLAVRAPTSAPGDVAVTVWKKAPPGMSLPADLENLPLIEIYDDVRDNY